MTTRPHPAEPPPAALQQRARELDTALFRSPFILIDTHNAAIATTNAFDDAQHALHHGDDTAAAVGTLHPDLTGIDIDPADTAAPPDAGDALADDLTTWLDHYGLPWLQRPSGRPGHHHLITAIPHLLRDEFTTTLHTARQHHAVAATPRQTLRLLTSPHRHGHPATHLTGTLEPHDLRTPARPQRSTQPARSHVRRRPRAKLLPASRSEREYGDTLALVRAHIPVEQAWTLLNQPGTKTHDIGHTAWRRWYWAPATTIVAAEHGATEHQAWEAFHAASPAQARYLGRTQWHHQRWLPALNEATQRRPRRTRIRPPTQAPNTPQGETTAPARAVDAVRQAFSRAVDHALAAGRLPSTIREQSLRATLDALAHPIAHTHGAISIRTWAETARLDPKTIRKARDVAQTLDIITRHHRYHGGPHDSDTWQPGPTVAERLLTTTTHSHTPYTPTHGHANPHKLRHRHSIERITWLARSQSKTASRTRISEENHVPKNRNFLSSKMSRINQPQHRREVSISATRIDVLLRVSSEATIRPPPRWTNRHTRHSSMPSPQIRQRRERT